MALQVLQIVFTALLCLVPIGIVAYYTSPRWSKWVSREIQALRKIGKAADKNLKK